MDKAFYGEGGREVTAEEYIGLETDPSYRKTHLYAEPYCCCCGGKMELYDRRDQYHFHNAWQEITEEIKPGRFGFKHLVKPENCLIYSFGDDERLVPLINADFDFRYRDAVKEILKDHREENLLVLGELLRPLYRQAFNEIALQKIEEESIERLSSMTVLQSNWRIFPYVAALLQAPCECDRSEEARKNNPNGKTKFKRVYVAGGIQKVPCFTLDDRLFKSSRESGITTIPKKITLCFDNNDIWTPYNPMHGGKVVFSLPTLVASHKQEKPSCERKMQKEGQSFSKRSAMPEQLMLL